ncbi:hypothetical protein RO3G_01268 [Lichtheimia corymbifera JMRC:FSU:9682]|uniref:Vacuolar segregation protein 7 n=1 Tax=Lichtheimia corymbifera JMRC:FSU:9682 TaxID=1263082 RepID=A0A068S8E3_9FUNG|nr:hypothetical protein RO3G_01268 [Lichtheimia corymbifera JMRC:FSU:9682]
MDEFHHPPLLDDGEDDEQQPSPPPQPSDNEQQDTTTIKQSPSSSSSPQQLSTSQKRQPLINKFPALHNEKYPSQLSRDLLSTNNFDRNLTVEKARFEPPQLISPTTSGTSPTMIPSPSPLPPPLASEDPFSIQSSLNHGVPDESILSSSAEGRYPATFSSTSTTGGGGGYYPSMTDMGSESDRNKSRRLSNTKKRRRPPPMHGSASPSEVFHRNLIDAVYNVEDSDENERYVYPYDNATRSTSGVPERPFLYRIHTMPTQHNKNPWLNNNWLPPEHRPKLRNHVIDHPHHHHHHHRSSKHHHDHPTAFLSRHHSPRRNRINIYNNRDGGYTSDDDEALPLLRVGRQSRLSPKRQSWCRRWCINLSFGFLVAILFFFLVTVYRATPLTDMSVELGRVLASDKELIFDLQVHANNWNWWTVRIAQSDIAVFAFSSLVPLDNAISSSSSSSSNNNDTLTITADPAEYLGSFYHFDEPLSFPPTFMTGNPSTAISQIRIKSPGADKSGAERWSRLIRYPYGLVTRGILKYTSIPYVALYPQSTAICNVAHVDPTTGTVSDKKPDEAYCPKDPDPSSPSSSLV